MLIVYSHNSTKEITQLDENMFEQRDLFIIFKFKEKKSKTSN